MLIFSVSFQFFVCHSEEDILLWERPRPVGTEASCARTAGSEASASASRPHDRDNLSLRLKFVTTEGQPGGTTQFSTNYLTPLLSITTRVVLGNQFDYHRWIRGVLEMVP